MYTLYYFNRNKQVGFLKTESLDEPLLIPEDLVFTNLRKDIHFIKEPHKCIDFTDKERLFMTSEFYDAEMINDSDYRRQNSYLTALCTIDPIDIIDLTDIEFTFGEGVSFWLPSSGLNSEYRYVFEYSIFPIGINNFIESDWNIFFSITENKWSGGTNDGNILRMRIKNTDLNIYSNIIEIPFPEV